MLFSKLKFVEVCYRRYVLKNIQSTTKHGSYFKLLHWGPLHSIDGHLIAYFSV